MTDERKTCADRVASEFRHEMERLAEMFKVYYEDSEAYTEDGDRLYEYGLSFDYVAPGTFNDQNEGYWRFQISWGGPSDEFRFFSSDGKSLHRVEYWYLDWFDGANVVADGDDLTLLTEFFEFFAEVGSVAAEYEKATEEGI